MFVMLTSKAQIYSINKEKNKIAGKEKIVIENIGLRM